MIYQKYSASVFEVWTGTGGRKDEDIRVREVCQAKPKSRRRGKTRLPEPSIKVSLFYR